MVDDDISLTAAIAGTKISPDFGSQTISTTGDLAVGTNSPSSKLQIQGDPTEPITGIVSITVSVSANTVNGSGTVFQDQLQIGDALKIGDNVFVITEIASQTSLTISPDAMQDYLPGTAYTDRDLFKIDNGASIPQLTVTGSGAIIIGAKPAPPGCKLAVDGDVIVEEVVVKRSDNWPDYVFDDDYSLPSLETVENHIKTHKHLPEIPGAKEVHEGGLSLSDMMTRQMKKIEELTLYMIELKKENTELKKRVAALEQ